MSFYSMAVDVNITGLADTGSELGSFMTNIAPGLGQFLLVVGIMTAIVGLVTAIVYFIRKKSVSK